MQTLRRETGTSILGRLREGLRLALAERPLRLVMVVAILSRLYVFAVAVTSNLLFGLNPACKTTLGCWNINLPFINLFSRWDSGYYADIATTGYSNSIVGRWEFFPAYPSVMGVLGRIIAGIFGLKLNLAVNLAGFIVSNIAFLVSVYLLYRISQKILGSVQLAAQSAILLAIYPAGVFLSAVYSEALFLCLTLWSLYYWYFGRHAASGIIGMLATLTRPIGALLAIPYLSDAVTTKSTRRRSVGVYLSIATIVFGLVCFAVYSEIITHTPFATFTAERSYWHVTLDPAYISALAINEIHDHPVIIPYLVMAFIGLAVSLLRSSKVEREIGLYSSCLLASYLIVPIISFPRYSITLIPMYWGLARLIRRGWARAFVYGSFLVLLAVGTALFANWYSFY